MSGNGVRDMEGYVRDLVSRSPDASGGNNNFWHLPDSGFGVRAPKGGARLGPLERTVDAFPGQNFGQAVASLGNVQIVKRQEGSPAGMPHRWWKQDERTQEGYRPEYKNKLAAAAAFDQSAYDEILRKMIAVY